MIFIGSAPVRLLPRLGVSPIVFDRQSGLVASRIQQTLLESVEASIHYQLPSGESPLQLFGFRAEDTIKAERAFEFAVAVEQEHNR